MADEYFTPEQQAADQADREVIDEVLDDAVADGASFFAALELDEPPDVVALWIDRLWDGLRDRLDPEQRLHAIIMLLEDDMRDDAHLLICHKCAARSTGGDR